MSARKNSKGEADSSVELETLVQSSYVNVTKETLPDMNKDVVFGQGPTACRCPHCKKPVMTFITYEASVFSWIIAICCALIFGWFSFLIIPIIWPVLKDVMHRCPECMNILKTKRRVGFNCCDGEVFTIEIGSMAIVLSKTYAMICGLIVGVLTLVFFLRPESWGHIDPLKLDHPGEKIDAKWQQYQFDCGMKRSFGNPIQVQRNFEAKYDHKNVDWEGEVLLVREGSSFLIWDNPSMMAIRMEPSYDRSKPDIIGLFGKEINDKVAEVNNGDRIKFNATCLSPGARGSTLIVKIWSIEKLPPLEDSDDGLPAGLLQMLMGGLGGTGGGIISMGGGGMGGGGTVVRRIVINGGGGPPGGGMPGMEGIPMGIRMMLGGADSSDGREIHHPGEKDCHKPDHHHAHDREVHHEDEEHCHNPDHHHAHDNHV